MKILFLVTLAFVAYGICVVGYYWFDWVANLESPVEAGLLYVAMAIALHGLFTARAK